MKLNQKFHMTHTTIKNEKMKNCDKIFVIQSQFHRHKEALLSDQCKEREENKNGKDQRLKKIRDTKGTLHAKMGTSKERNGVDITEVENIKKRWQDYTKKKKKH